MMKDVVKKLIEKGKIERGYLGVVIEDLKGNLKEVYDHKQGAVIVEVTKESAAAKAGLKRGDLIIEVDGEPIEDANELKTIIGSKAPGQEVSIKYERNHKVYTTKVKLGERPSGVGGEATQTLKGLEVKNIDENTRKMYNIPSDIQGVLVEDVKENSAAEKAGIKPGDVITGVEDMEIKKVEDLKKALTKYKGPKRVYIWRQGYPLILVLK